jgi:hypothetical protein
VRPESGSARPTFSFTPGAFIQSVIAGDKNTVEWFLKVGMRLYSLPPHLDGEKSLFFCESVALI